MAVFYNLYKKDNFQSGQALVLVLLSLSVVLTIVLFILSRSITDVAVSSRGEEAVRAFSAAEAGIERALILGSGGANIQIGDATYSADVSNFAEGSKSLAYPIPLSSGDTATLWFVAHDSNGNAVCSGALPCFTGRQIKVCWGKSGTASSAAVTPAIELSVFYNSVAGDPATAKIARAAFDPNNARASTNAFSLPDAGTCTINGVTYQFQKSIDLAGLGIGAGSYNSENGLQFARLRMLYNSDTAHEVGFDTNFAGGSALPSQGLSANSLGTAGDSNRRLDVFQGWPEAPGVFDYAIYSSTGLTK